MKKILFAFLLMLACQLCQAQSGEVAPNSTGHSSASTTRPVLGYLSYDSVLTHMSDYVIVQARMQQLRQAYQQELKRVEDEFNQKYEAFLEGQKDFPRTILLKRQTELQQLLQQNLEFKRQGQQELAQAEREALEPLRARISQAIAEIAREQELVVVVNTDSDACPFIDPDLSVDVTLEVLSRLETLIKCLQ
jgi:outer membrane protein